MGDVLEALPVESIQDSSNKENAIEDEEEEEEDDDEEDDDLEVKEENGVLVLNDANFDNFVADKDTVLLEFYAPWCGHCKQFAPEYEKIANTLKDNDPPIPVAKIDATSASMLASRFDVSGYPTIKILKKGQAVDYEGSRTQEEIVTKVREVSQPDWTPPPEVTLVLTKENFDEVVNDADIILVEFYAPWCGHCKKLAPEYEKAAKELSKHSPPIPLAKVDATAETDLAKRFDVSGYPTLKIFRKGRPFDYNGPREKYGIVDYMIEQSGPPSKEILTLKQVQEFLKDGDDVIIIGAFKGESDPAYQQYQDAANNLREDYKFHHTFSTEIAKFLKVSQGQLVVMQPEKFQSKYEPRSHVMDVQVSRALCHASLRHPAGVRTLLWVTSEVSSVEVSLCLQGLELLFQCPLPTPQVFCRWPVVCSFLEGQGWGFCTPGRSWGLAELHLVLPEQLLPPFVPPHRQSPVSLQRLFHCGFGLGQHMVLDGGQTTFAGATQAAGCGGYGGTAAFSVHQRELLSLAGGVCLFFPLLSSCTSSSWSVTHSALEGQWEFPAQGEPGASSAS
ncbi:Protein disulfide-isomerase A4 [Plecturocebus cupreus]